jgi:hypothetical protein
MFLIDIIFPPTLESVAESLISNVHAGGKALRLASLDAEQTYL